MLSTSYAPLFRLEDYIYGDGGCRGSFASGYYEKGQDYFGEIMDQLRKKT